MKDYRAMTVTACKETGDVLETCWLVADDLFIQAGNRAERAARETFSGTFPAPFTVNVASVDELRNQTRAREYAYPVTDYAARELLGVNKYTNLTAVPLWAL